MLVMASGFIAVCILLSISFYRRYRSHLGANSPAGCEPTLQDTPGQYARIEDYHGLPIALAFDYLDDENAWSYARVDVDEIYHYGRDYFLKGRNSQDRRCRIFKWSKIANVALRSGGRNLRFVQDLMGEAREIFSGGTPGGRPGRVPIGSKSG